MDAATIRAQLTHPVIDADGHQIEFIPLVRDLLAADAGEAVAQRFDSAVNHTATDTDVVKFGKRSAPTLGTQELQKHARRLHRVRLTFLVENPEHRSTTVPETRRSSIL